VLVQGHLRLKLEPLAQPHAHRVAEVAAGGGADEQHRDPEMVRDEHPVGRDERHRAEDRPEEREDDRAARHARRRLPLKVLRVALDDAGIELMHGRHTLLIGGERGGLEDRRSLVRELLQTSHLAPNEAGNHEVPQLRKIGAHTT
jgi:hypothetical protein